MSTNPLNKSTEVLDAATCWLLLGGQTIGRVAYIDDERPMIVPVNFAVIDGRIVFRSDPGDKVSSMPLQHVCIEADGSDDANHVWSVVVRGVARDVTTALDAEYEEMRRTLVTTFASLTEPHWIAIDVESISGRRLSR